MDFRVAGLPRGLGLRADLRISARGGVVRGALKDGQMTGFFRYDRDKLDGRSPRADTADPFAAEVHLFLRPVRGVKGLAFEAVDAFKRRCILRG